MILNAVVINFGIGNVLVKVDTVSGIITDGVADNGIARRIGINEYSECSVAVDIIIGDGVIICVEVKKDAIV